ncbi:UvrD-helicase domain-containing protein [Nocardioides sp. CPCC 205120]|uniref:UvrD-helicase domain-containing protein n=1 Tax=Nocardioides sp. CPCC 205120 TaxID=3406462 RepID=UPI003B50E4FD
MTSTALDASQRAAVEISPEERQLVVAGPGSGKTEVVSALVERLVDLDGAGDAGAVLVISFSNAAVHAVDARLTSRGLGPVTVQTMDSLATEVLRDLATDDYSGLDFDGRVVAASRCLAEQGWDALDGLDHLVVDEIQDVVGVRADFLLAIIDALPDTVGFTLLGDPAQGIYDFQLRPPERGRAARSTTDLASLLSAAEGRHGAIRRHLDGQYRASSREAKVAARLREAALPGGDPGIIDTFYDDVAVADSLEAVADLVRKWSGTTAVLTATNGQALLVAGILRSLGLTVEVRRGAEQRVLAPWIAQLFGDATTDTVSRGVFEQLVADRRPDIDVATTWRSLRGAVGGRGSELDLPRLATRLRTRRPLPPELLVAPTGTVVVSTVHRAKGLEFDNVVLVDFPERTRDADPAGETERLRARFVALTRARTRLVRAVGPDDRALRVFSRRGLHQNRWFLAGRQSWMTFAYEVGIGDVEPGPEGLDEAGPRPALETQLGGPVDLRLDPRASTLDVPVYNLLRHEAVIGRTSLRFGEDLALRIEPRDGRRGPWPTLGGAYVENVCTALVDPQPGGRSRHGLLLAPVVTGLLNINWK